MCRNKCAIVPQSMPSNLLDIKTKTGETKEFRGPLNLPTNFNIKIPIADKISSLGDLSTLYLGDFQVNTAANLKILKLGNDTPGYFNTYLKSLNIANLNILSYLDITNCVGLTGTINLSTCPNLLEVKALGTNIESFTFSATGQLEKLLLPKTFEKLNLTNQINLKYYEEILEKNGLKPEECVMIGNDVSEDMITEKLGMKAFLLTDCLINKEEMDISLGVKNA